jgi:hypothetical protein
LAASLSPQGSNLLTGILPFDWPTAELALQKFFDQLDNLEEQLVDSRTPVSVMRWLAATMAITVTFDVTRRHLRKRAALAGLPADGSNGKTWTWFPGMADPVSDG